jgi:dTDP-4-amino-4,6-dideoxygalactose transaminase
MLLTADRDLADRARYLATQARLPVAHYEHLEVGYNYRLSNLLAALGRAQLCRLDEMIDRRRALRSHYAALFARTVGVRILGDSDDANAWLTPIVIDPAVAGWSAGELAAHLAADLVETRPMWKPMHLQPAFDGARSLLSGAAQRLFETGLILPSGSALTDGQVARVSRSMAGFLDRVG